MYSIDIKSTREVTLMQNCAPKIFFNCELCTILQKAAVAKNSVLHLPKSIFILQSNTDMEPLTSLKKATVEPHIKTLPTVLNRLPRVSFFPISLPTPQLTFESRITGVLADKTSKIFYRSSFSLEKS